MGGFEADKTPDHVGTSDQSLKPWPELGGVGELPSRLEGAIPPGQPHPNEAPSPVPSLLLTVKEPAFVRSLRPELGTYIWGAPTLSQAQSKAREIRSILATTF